MKNRRFYKILLQIVLFTAIVFYITSCSSSENDKYSLITKEDRKSIEEFCKCTEPFQEMKERFRKYLKDTTKLNNIDKDSAFIRSMPDSIELKLKEITPCLDIVRNVFDSEKMEKEKEGQLKSYLKKFYPKCSNLILHEM
jgi:hypothetical protein